MWVDHHFRDDHVRSGRGSGLATDVDDRDGQPGRRGKRAGSQTEVPASRIAHRLTMGQGLSSIFHQVHVALTSTAAASRPSMPQRQRRSLCCMSHLSNVWFKVTDLQVTHGRGCRVTTVSGDEYLDFAAGIAVNSTGHAHPKVAAAIGAQAERFIHAQINVFTHDLAEPLAAKLAEITPADDRHVLLRQLRRRDHRGRGQARQAGHEAPEHHRVPGFVPRPHAHGDGDDDIEDRLPRRPRAAAVGRVRQPVPRPDGGRSGRRYRRRAAGLRSAAAGRDRAVRDGGGDHRAGARRGRLHAGAARRSSRASSSAAGGTASSSSPTRCRVASVAPARGSRSSTTTSSPTSSAWRRASLRASRSQRSARARELDDLWPKGSHGGTYGGNPMGCAAALATIEVMSEPGFMENVRRARRAARRRP